MIKLITLLNECFYTSQWLDILQKYPEIINLLKNDAEVNRHNSLFGTKIKDWGDLHNVAYQISYIGGHCGLNALSNFNLQDLVSRSMYLYMNDKEFRDKLYNFILPLLSEASQQTVLNISGSKKV